MADVVSDKQSVSVSADIPPGDDKTQQIGERVPPDRERADLDGDRVDGWKGDGEHHQGL